MGEEDADAAFDPDEFELLAYVYAVESARDHERYGRPYEGTVRDQPALWKHAVDCYEDATGQGRARAEHDAEADRRARERNKQD